MSADSIDCQFQLSFGQFSLDVDVQLPCQGIIGLFGHSGSGKTTLLRCIAGLERTQTGFMRFNDQTWQNATVFLPTHQRPIGYVFQEASLFSHLSVMGNLKFAQQRADQAPTIKFDQALEILNIRHLLNQNPAQLSGGERQRVAIARALLINPKLLLMDEPLSSLDAAHKKEILPYLEQLHRELTIPIIYVSHSVDEIARLADHLVVLDQGRVVASGNLTETLARLDFPLKLGEETGVVLNGKVAEHDQQWRLMRVEFDGGELWIRDHEATVGQTAGQTVRLHILAKDVSLALERHQSSILNVLPGTVNEIVEDHDSGSALINVAVGSSFITSKITLRSVAHLNLNLGDKVWAQIKSVALVQ